MRFVRASALLAAVTVALAVPLVVLAGSSSKAAAPTFSFGRTGGNIIPFKVTIGRDGHVAATGPVQATQPTASLPLRNGLAKLAKAEGFFTMALNLTCGPTHPDVASRFVTVTAYGKTRTVLASGTCNAAFEELYAVLAAATGTTV